MRHFFCTAVLVSTNRMFGRKTASQIASASAASLFWRFQIALHVSRRHQANGMTKCLQGLRPIM
jgi:hypothetical protein